MKVTKDYLKKLIMEELSQGMTEAPVDEAMSPEDKAMNQLERLVDRYEETSNKYLMKLEDLSLHIPKLKQFLLEAENKRLASDSEIVSYVFKKVSSLTGMGYY